MKKIDYIEQLYFMLGSNDETDHHPKQLCEAYLDAAWNSILHDTFRMDITNFDMYGKWYVVSIAQNATSERYESVLPEEIVQLPSRSEGVRKVLFEDGANNDTYTFYPISEDDFFFTKNQQSNDAYRNGIDYIVKFDRVEYGYNMDATLAANDVKMLLIIPFRKYDDDDQIPVPSGKQQDFFNIAYNMGMSRPPVDLSNRNDS